MTKLTPKFEKFRAPWDLPALHLKSLNSIGQVDSNGRKQWSVCRNWGTYQIKASEKERYVIASAVSEVLIIGSGVLHIIIASGVLHIKPTEALYKSETRLFCILNRKHDVRRKQ